MIERAHSHDVAPKPTTIPQMHANPLAPQMHRRGYDTKSSSDSVPQHVPTVPRVRSQRGVSGQPAAGEAARGGVADSAHRAGQPRAREGDGVGQLSRRAHVARLPQRAGRVLQRLFGGVGTARLQECDPAAPGAGTAAAGPRHAAMARLLPSHSCLRF